MISQPIFKTGLKMTNMKVKNVRRVKTIQISGCVYKKQLKTPTLLLRGTKAIIHLLLHVKTAKRQIGVQNVLLYSNIITARRWQRRLLRHTNNRQTTMMKETVFAWDVDKGAGIWQTYVFYFRVDGMHNKPQKRQYQYTVVLPHKN